MTSLRTRRSPESNFWLFFWSTVFSVIGLDLYLFTHGWFLVELGANKQSIGVSWAIFFLPSLVMLPLCGKLLEERPIRSILLSFEIAKAFLLWSAFLLFKFTPSLTSVYLVSALLGISFSPFYPATYTLLRELFTSQSVVRYSNLFEISLQLAGSFALVGSGFILESFGFVGIVLIAAVTVTTSCIFLFSMDDSSQEIKVPKQSWAQAFQKSFLLQDRSQIRKPQFLLGLVHQVPQTCILLSNIPLVLYVSHMMNAGPKEYGFLDGLYGFAALAASLLWARWPQRSSNRNLLILMSALGAIGFVQFALLPSYSPLPYLYMILFAIVITSSKIMSRAAFIQSSEKEFIATYSPFFQIVSNLSLVIGAFLVGILMDHQGVQAAMLSLAAIMLMYSLLMLALKQKRPTE